MDLIKSNQRVADHREVFTPPWMVDAMLDLVKGETERIDARFLEPDLFRAVTGLTVQDFHLLVQLKVFNTEQMNAAVFAFRRYEDASLSYTGIPSHEGLRMRGGWDTVVAWE
jgi:hypothetical protein